MSKTIFQNNTYLTPTFMEASFGIDATTGHTHDGLDADGSLPKVSLTDDVTDTLNLNTMVDGELDLTTNVEGFLDSTHVVSEGSVNVSLTTGYASPVAATLTYTKIGDRINLHLPKTTGTSNSSSLYISAATTWPAEILAQNTSDQSAVSSLIVINETYPGPGQIDLPDTTDAIIRVSNMTLTHLSYVDNGFTNTSTKGFPEQTICYKGA